MNHSIFGPEALEVFSAIDDARAYDRLTIEALTKLGGGRSDEW